LACVLFADEASEKAAQTASEQWLGLVDTGKYGESWEQAAAMFKSAVPKEQWVEQAGAVRGQMGTFKSRKLKSSEYTESLPNAPAGKYVVLQYDAVYSNGSFVETVIPMLEKDGSWKVSGYFAKPA
jgi:hypothetical protein